MVNAGKMKLLVRNTSRLPVVGSLNRTRRRGVSKSWREIGQLSKSHAKIMVEAGKTLDLVPSAIARHTTAKRRHRQMLRDLRKHQFAQVHGCPLRVSSSQDRKSSASVSNRDQKNS